MSHALIVVEALGDLAVGVVGGDLVRDEVVEAAILVALHETVP